jgi:hypothetical protein
VKYDAVVKRWAFTILLFLVLGAIVNVAVAWALVACVNLTKSPRLVGLAGDGVSRWQGMAHASIGGYLFTSTWWPNNLPPFATQAPKAAIVPEWAPVGHVSPWTAQDTDRNKTHNDLIDARGWPMLSLLSWEEHHEGTTTRRAGIDLKFWPWHVANGRTVSRVLPTRPIWPGVAINTVFYAGVLWLLFGAPFALRKWRRIKRGFCVKCGYDLRQQPSDSSVCPECGTTVR